MSIGTKFACVLTCTYIAGTPDEQVPVHATTVPSLQPQKFFAVALKLVDEPHQVVPLILARGVARCRLHPAGIAIRRIALRAILNPGFRCVIKRHRQVAHPAHLDRRSE